MSPTARSLKLLRDLGYMVAVVEKTIPKSYIKQDLFGCIDILGVAVSSGKLIAVQTTDASNLSKRVDKCEASVILQIWKLGGHKFEVHGWSKRGAAGTRKTWQVVRREL